MRLSAEMMPPHLMSLTAAIVCAVLLNPERPADAADATAPVASSTVDIEGADALGAGHAHFDIKPGQCPNTLIVAGPSMLLAGVSASILGNAFDVTQVDLLTVKLARVTVENDGEGDELAAAKTIRPIEFVFEDTGTPFAGDQCECHALHGDGVLDLALKFDKQQMIEVFGLASEPSGTLVPLQVSGRFLGSQTTFRAQDCIKVKK